MVFSSLVFGLRPMIREHFLFFLLQTPWPGTPKSESTRPRARAELGAPFSAAALLGSVEETGTLLQQPYFFLLVLRGDHGCNPRPLVPTEQRHGATLPPGKWDVGSAAVQQALLWPEPARPWDMPGLGLGRRWQVLRPCWGEGCSPQLAEAL